MVENQLKQAAVHPTHHTVSLAVTKAAHNTTSASRQAHTATGQRVRGQSEGHAAQQTEGGTRTSYLQHLKLLLWHH